MTDNDVSKTSIVARLNGVEENHAPKSVEEDYTKSEGGTYYEKHVGSTFQSHCSGTVGIGENVNALKELKATRMNFFAHYFLNKVHLPQK